MTGEATLTGEVALTGEATLTGEVALTGEATLTGEVALTGEATLTGDPGVSVSLGVSGVRGSFRFDDERSAEFNSSESDLSLSPSMVVGSPSGEIKVIESVLVEAGSLSDISLAFAAISPADEITPAAATKPIVLATLLIFLHILKWASPNNEMESCLH